MVVKSFYKNQRELAEVINELIDLYWNNQLGERSLIDNINKICMNNKEKVFKDGEFTKILQQQCGKKRLEVIDKVTKM